MSLYLVRHARAAEGPIDRERPLTEGGATDAERVARRLAAAGIQVERVYHSGRLRAEQTARILADRLPGPPACEPRKGLDYSDDPAATARWLGRLEAEGSVMVVSHMPFIASLAAQLIWGEPDATAIGFKVGAIARLDRVDDRFALVWLLTPKLA